MLTVNLLVLAGLAFVKTQEISFESCNKTSVCVKAPGCETPQNCPALAMYHHNTTTDRLHFTLFFKSKWAAFAQNTFVKKDNRMVNAKGFTCTHPIPLSETKVEPLNLRFMLSKGFDAPEMVKADQISEVSDVELATVDGVHMCSFSRPISLNSIEGFKYLYNLDLSTDLLNIIVFGNKVDGTGLAYHGPDNYFVDKSKPAVDWKTFTGVVAEEIEPSAEVMPSSSQMASIYDTSSMMMMMSSKSIMASMSVSDSVGMTTDAMMSVSDSVMMEMSSMVSTTPDVAMSSKSMDASTTPSEETPMVKPSSSSTIIDVISSKAPSTPTTTTRPTVKRTTKFNLSHATTCTASISVLVIAISALVTMLM
uniref:Cnidarian restricted protein n=1 Tax=Clytia hemisphaerica TaxID=252671 RepID=A0A7M5WX71_9CNID|eukprot:TCONS_00060577-protein